MGLLDDMRASGGLRPALGVTDKHVTKLLEACVDYIEERNIIATEKDIDALSSILYEQNLGTLEKIDEDLAKVVAQAYFKGKSVKK